VVKELTMNVNAIFAQIVLIEIKSSQRHLIT
jgi:hypothetical protein